MTDREPQPSDGPDYHAEHAAWEERNAGAIDRGFVQGWNAAKAHATRRAPDPRTMLADPATVDAVAEALAEHLDDEPGWSRVVIARAVLAVVAARLPEAPATPAPEPCPTCGGCGGSFSDGPCGDCYGSGILAAPDGDDEAEVERLALAVLLKHQRGEDGDCDCGYLNGNAITRKHHAEHVAEELAGAAVLAALGRRGDPDAAHRARQEDCSNCGGGGNVFDPNMEAFACPRCHGTGRLAAAPPAVARVCGLPDCACDGRWHA